MSVVLNVYAQLYTNMFVYQSTETKSNESENSTTTQNVRSRFVGHDL